MVFKKPYAFFIKYFRFINFLLVCVLGFILYKLNLLRMVINDIYLNKTINYSSLSYDYIGFKMYFFIFIALLILSIIIVLLRKKKKPLADYGYTVIYLLVILVFLIVVNNLFFTLSNITVEPATIKTYSDIASLILLPMLYFIFKIFTISIGFNLKKFDFTKDLIELKSEIGDDEEIELSFSKDIYKYKRKFRKFVREFKYYMLENRLIYGIITGVIVIGVVVLFLLKGVDSNEVQLNEQFLANGFTYTVRNVYETKYDYNRNLIKSNNKFVVLEADVNRVFDTNSSIDLKKIRLLYGDNFVYASSYYHDRFLDLGNAYKGQLLLRGEKQKYLFVFKVPASYKGNNYEIKFFDKTISDENEYKAAYKMINVSAKNLDKNYENYDKNYEEVINFDSELYGNSFLIIKKAELLFKYQDDDKLILPNDINDVLLYVEYDLNLDENNNILSSYTDKQFFENYLVLQYTYGKKLNTKNNLFVVDNFDGKIFLSVPYNSIDGKDIKVNIAFRKHNYVFKIEKN